jgi:AraC-like DNA-binding protein
MTRKKWIIIAVWGWLAAATLAAQPLCQVVKYDEEDGVPSSHVAQLLQDEQGFMWFATWNGLCRYDGYEFKTFKPQVGDGCHMTTDRIRNITLLPTGDIQCQVDYEYFLFERKTYRFRDLTETERQQAEEQAQKNLQSRSLQRKPFVWTDQHQTRWTLEGNGRLSYEGRTTGQQVEYPLPTDFHTLTFAMADKQGNLWALDYGNIYKLTTDVQRSQRLPIEPQAEVKCLFNDSQGRYWVATKGDEVLRIYSRSNDELIGYLGADGRIHQRYTRLGAAVYCMYETKDGTLWLGTKPQGLFRLQPTGGNTYKIVHFTDIPHRDIYHITEDRWGRLWVATLGGGIFYTEEKTAEKPHFIVPPHYPKDDAQRARYLLLTEDDVMMVATGGGLLTAKLERNAEKMRFQRHQREPNRKESLSCSATMDVVQDRLGRYFVSTESGGVNEIMNSNLLDSVLTFHHLREHFHVQPNDIVLSLTATPDNGLIAVGSHLITLTDKAMKGRVLDARYFNGDYRFSEAHPLALGNGRWLFGLTNGAFTTTIEQMLRQTLTPRLVLTYLEVRGEQKEERGLWNAESLDTLTLQPDERTMTIHFAALDYQAPARISYAFRLTETAADSTAWNYIGHNRSATLLDLEPGTYLLEVRSTNADGEWTDNSRWLTIIVKPTFWEAWYGQLLIVVLIVGTLAAIACTLLYIRRIKRQQRETLEKYLALIEARSERQEAREDTESQDKPVTSELDPMLQRVMQFVEENIGNSDAGVGEMALAAAVSRSGLQRKLKQAMGVTPQELMKEARIKRAIQLLRETDKTISEVAYACGFSDPKYFSRSFKQSTGQSPSELRIDN